ncbi:MULTISPECIES: PH domain-containing protein [Bacillus cereus group]|uniref:PH domain-containing protein n=1 Tax=Bacillus cereus group TaxID=86661 RepID=UPI000E2FF6A0|nr:PH domain-containing protein [Bacillus paramycoides]MCW9130156.1 PH domain-containing protein [Bacillus paramycoides]MED0962485.1 PH domain-containing protein [Bacillus paramycoides]MED0980405.1 PH domain-containing protein [Bacillus paramycoides]MED0985475.1 PH domain-containing protein [Bacillus paramycoides]MED1091613.1 PH domain-containing protein [Bacillus paramycoides]
MIYLKFKAKKNPFHIILISLFIVVFFISLFFQNENSIFFTLMMLLNIVNLSSFYFSHYKITQSSLVIKHGFILRTEIPFEDIRHIKYSGKKLYSEKWTRQQLEIYYNLFDSVTSFVPQEEEQFISYLKENCPHMKVID